jgi:Septum formation initiator
MKRSSLVLVPLVLAIVLAVYGLCFAENGLIQLVKLARQVREQTAKNEELASYNDSLFREVSTLKKAAAIENKARGDLGMIKEGEVFYRVLK